MKYHILFIEPRLNNKMKSQPVADLVNSFISQVETAGGKIYVNHDVVMMGVYDATIIVVVNYEDHLKPDSTTAVSIITKSFADEKDLLNYSLMRNISVVKKAYLKSKALFEINVAGQFAPHKSN